MIRTKLVEEKLRKERLDSKSLDNLFRRRIEQGANCPPFVSSAILETAKEIFPICPEDADNTLGLGQMKLLVVAGHEPAGKLLELCQKVTVRLTLDSDLDDYEIRIRDGVEGLRRARILRMTAEACEQGGVLSYEDLAFRLLNCGIRTIVRDVAALRKRDLEVPSRGQQQGIGPSQTHRVQAIRLYLRGHEANEIALRLYHTLAAIENYLNTFARVVFLIEKKRYDDDEIAFVIRRSGILVAAYRKLYEEFLGQRSAQRRLNEILAKIAKNTTCSGKKGVQS
jgi:hypothetical protein